MAVGEPLPGDGEWVLVVDGERRPQGWLSPADDRPERRNGDVVEPDHLVPGGSLYDLGSGSLRSALDAALSSPSGVGVAVDAEGRVAGAVSADDVLRGARRRPPRRRRHGCGLRGARTWSGTGSRATATSSSGCSASTWCCR